MKRTEIITIFDTSGSMESIRADAEGGYNAFIDEQKKLPGEARLTSVTFSSSVVSSPTVDVREAPRFTLRPNGGTALYDAIGTTLMAQAKRIAEEKWADSVILVIVTDGGENASCFQTRDGVKGMITMVQNLGWRVVFLAANQDAFAVSAGMGISQQFTHNFRANSIGTRSMTETLSAYASNARGVGSLQDIQKAAEKLMG